MIYSNNRFLSFPIRLQGPTVSFVRFTSASSADQFYKHLQNNGVNIEKSLASLGPNLNPNCVSKVLRSCYPSQIPTGLRFFIWAGLQPKYRHTSFMYSKVCELFEIKRNPRVLVDVIEAYRAERCLVSVKTFKVILNLYKVAGLADEAFLLLRKMPEFNLRPDTTMYNIVLRLFCEKGDLGMTESLMKEMILIDLYPDMITYIEIVKGYCNIGRFEDAYALFEVMKGHGCVPNSVLYSMLLHGFLKHDEVDRGLKLLREMEEVGGNCSPNVVTYTSVIQMFCEKGQLSEALEILHQMEVSRRAPNRVTVSYLINCFVEKDKIQEVYKLIHRVVRGGGVSYGECYSCLVLSLRRATKSEEAEKVFRMMLKHGLRPDGAACSIMIRGLCLEGRVLDGYHLCDEIEKMENPSSIDSDIYSVLLVGLCQQAHLTEAAKLARSMLEKRVQLKAPNVERITEILERTGDMELVNHFKSQGDPAVSHC